MTQVPIDFSAEDLERLQKLQQKYGFSNGSDLIKFLIRIFDQHYVEFLWGLNEYDKRDEYGIYQHD